MRWNIQRQFERIRESLQDTMRQQRQTLRSTSILTILSEQGREFMAALQFLTIIDLPASSRWFRSGTTTPRYISGGAYFPIVGFIVGLLLSVVPLVFAAVFPPLVLGALLVVAWIVLTGGLHLDGLMDTCDGVFGRSDRARKLEIMKDSRVGSFGVLGGVCVLLLKFVLLGSMSTHLLFPALWIVPTVARWGMLATVRIFPVARTTGLGAAFRQTLTTPHLLAGALIALVIALLFGHFVGLLVWFGMTLATLIVGACVTQSLGGLTGDVYGSVAEVAEVFGLLLFLLLRFWF